MNETLRTALAAKGINRLDIAAKLQVDPKTVERWLSGRLPHPSSRAALAKLLDVDETELWPTNHRRAPRPSLRPRDPRRLPPPMGRPPRRLAQALRQRRTRDRHPRLQRPIPLRRHQHPPTARHQSRRQRPHPTPARRPRLPRSRPTRPRRRHWRLRSLPHPQRPSPHQTARRPPRSRTPPPPNGPLQLDLPRRRPATRPPPHLRSARLRSPRPPPPTLRCRPLLHLPRQL